MILLEFMLLIYIIKFLINIQGIITVRHFQKNVFHIKLSLILFVYIFKQSTFVFFNF